MMTDVTEQDWDLVNAYHDGALSPSEAKAFEARLEREPELSDMLRHVTDLSERLAKLRPAEPASAPDMGRAGPGPGPGFVSGLIAASLVAAAIAFWPAPQPNLFDVHTGWAGTPAISDASVHLAQAADAPSLAGADMTLVAYQRADSYSVTHYAGKNGCRLSFFAGLAPGLTVAARPGTQVETWEDDAGQRFAVMATGMDAGKFAAIAAYLQDGRAAPPSPTVLAALQDATAAAVPCIG